MSLRATGISRGGFGDLGDWFTRAANSFSFGTVDYVNRNVHGMDGSEIARQSNSSAGQGGENFAVILGILMPGPGKGKAVQALTRPRTANRGLAIGERFLGKGYKEIGNPNSGVFRSADGLRQFRMTDSDILGMHGKIGPHFNFEIFNRSGNLIKNYHMAIR